MKITKIETNFRRKMFLHTSNPMNFNENKQNLEKNLINIYPSIEFQNIIGFGGAFTEASGYSLAETPDDIYNNVINDYFSVNGLNYSLCRTHIGSCDFCLKSYSYLYDDNIENFSIEHDKKYIIPMIKKALKVNPSINFLASPWSPPSFMKDNNRLILGGKLLPKYYDLYALYLARYIEKYKKENINIKYLTLQNEANFAAPWESCLYSPEEELTLLNKSIIPCFNSKNINTKLLVWDHNKEKILDRANVYFKNNSNNIAGIAFHWYSGDYFEEVELINKLYPNKLLIHTEGCTGYSRFKKTDEVKNAEIYGHDILGDLNSGANGFIDWNMSLNYKGGPNHKFNYCNAPIMITKNNDNYVKNLSYYYIGHFSKYIKPGAKRIGYSKFTDKIEVCTFKNLDNSVIIVLLNRNDFNMQYTLKFGNHAYKDNLDSHCIVTFIIND